MRILCWGLGFPTLVLLLQVVLWRIRRPENDVQCLLLLWQVHVTQKDVYSRPAKRISYLPG